jgi:tetratricopeptide (TPR) repeat protein
MKPINGTTLKRFFAESCQKPILPGALLLLATLLLYASVSHHQFLEFDDSQYVTKNGHVTTGLNAENLQWAFTTFHEANWHPLTWLSHMADCSLFGLNPGPHHLMNVALHAANVLILFLLLQRASGALWRSLFVAALFAVHPLNVETVAWVAQRKSLLGAFFSLLTIAAYGWYVRKPGWRRYLAIIAAFTLALMSKPMAVSLPFVLLLLDYWPLERYAEIPMRRRLSRLLPEKLPLLLMSVAGSVVTLVAQRAGGAIADASVLPLDIRVQNAIVSYAVYLGKMLWPVNLAVLYPHAKQALPWTMVAAASVMLALITAAALYLRRAPYLATGWLLFLSTLIPVIGIVQVGRQAIADRYAYIPFVGLFIIVAWSIASVAERWPVFRTTLVVIAVCVVSLFAAATANYLQFWEGGVKLFTHAQMVASEPDAMLEETLADALVVERQISEAFKHYQRACALDPSYPLCHYNMAEILFAGFRLRSALEQYQLAGRLTRSKEMAVACLINSGQILLELGNPDLAEIQLAAALQIDPTNNTAFQLRQQAANRKLRR